MLGCKKRATRDTGEEGTEKTHRLFQINSHDIMPVVYKLGKKQNQLVKSGLKAQENKARQRNEQDN